MRPLHVMIIVALLGVIAVLTFAITSPVLQPVITGGAEGTVKYRLDGITYANYGQFDAMWFDAHYFPASMKDRAYIVVVPQGEDTAL